MIITAEDVLAGWIEAVNGGDIEKLLELYDSQAVLIPTFSNRLLNTPINEGIILKNWLVVKA